MLTLSQESELLKVAVKSFFCRKLCREGDGWAKLTHECVPWEAIYSCAHIFARCLVRLLALAPPITFGITTCFFCCIKSKHPFVVFMSLAWPRYETHHAW